MTSAPTSAACTMPWMMPANEPLPVAGFSTFTAISSASGATPIVPMPLSAAPMVPITCVPCVLPLVLQ